MNISLFPPNDSVINKMNLTDIADQINIMRTQEETTYKCIDYFNQFSILNKNNSFHEQNKSQQVNEKCRLKIYEWCCQIASFCGYRSETVAIGMSLLDRYLSNCEEVNVQMALSDPKMFQLAAMTTLYISIKLHEPVLMDIETLSKLSRGCYSVKDIEQMESQIFKTLKWRVNGPSKLDFIYHFLSLLPSNVGQEVTSNLLSYSEHQADLSVSDYKFVTANASVVALSAVLNSLERIKMDVFGMEDRMTFLQSISDAYGDIDPVCLNEMGMELLELSEPTQRTSELDAFGMFNIICVCCNALKKPKKMINVERRRSVCRQLEPRFSFSRTR